MNVSRLGVLGRDRTYHPTLARHVAMWVARRKRNASLAVLGGAFGRDHSTAVMAIQRIERLRAANPAFLALTDDLLARAP